MFHRHNSKKGKCKNESLEGKYFGVHIPPPVSEMPPTAILPHSISRLAVTKSGGPLASPVEFDRAGIAPAIQPRYSIRPLVRIPALAP